MREREKKKRDLSLHIDKTERRGKRGRERWNKIEQRKRR